MNNQIRIAHAQRVAYALEKEEWYSLKADEFALLYKEGERDFRWANLRWANLSSANLSWANLRSANLSWANLSSANLSSANLSSANLSWADLGSADLSWANLSSANLSSADLSSADLSSADLSSIYADFVSKAVFCPHELEGLRLALVEGRVDGSTYEGACACFVGTIANIACVDKYALGIKVDSDSPIERFFLAISQGDTPDTNPVSKIVVEWIDGLVGFAKAFAAKPE